MPKFALFGLLAGATLLGIGPSGAFFGRHAHQYEGPWCVIYDLGSGFVQENCAMPNFEACNIERAHWGSTAFCHQNPRFAGSGAAPGPQPRPRKPQKKHRR